MPTYREFSKRHLDPGYKCDFSWKYLIFSWISDNNLDTTPYYQREKVWTTSMSSRYIESMIEGATKHGRDIYINGENWPSSSRTELIDGQQRICAVGLFLSNNIKAFGSYYKEFKGSLPLQCRFHANISNFTSEIDKLELYLAINDTGKSHTPAEKNRVIKMLDNLGGK